MPAEWTPDESGSETKRPKERRRMEKERRSESGAVGAGLALPGETSSLSLSPCVLNSFSGQSDALQS